MERKRQRSYWDDEANSWTPHTGQGSAHGVSNDHDERDAVDKLHDVVEEITGKRPGRPSRRIGFI